MTSNISFNTQSKILQNQIRLSNRSLSTATERLSTGMCINASKDNPFKNYEAKNVESDITSNNRAKQNSLDGASLLQIAEGSCTEIQNILQRIRELSVQGANDTLSSTERHYLQIESQELLKEIDRISTGTTFNSKVIFGNSNDSFSGWQKDGEERKIKDWTPFLFEEGARPGILHIGITSGAEKIDSVKISIPEISAKSLGLDTLSLTYQNGAATAIDDLDSALSSLSTIRSYMGSYVRRMEDQVEDLSSTNIGLNNYIGKIQDTDFAKESTTLASSQIQVQAAMSILSQCNSKISRVLEILG